MVMCVCLYTYLCAITLQDTAAEAARGQPSGSPDEAAAAAEVGPQAAECAAKCWQGSFTPEYAIAYRCILGVRGPTRVGLLWPTSDPKSE